MFKFEAATEYTPKKVIPKRIEPVGSRITCSPPPMDTDEDFLVLVNYWEFEDYVWGLHREGYDLGGSDITPAEGFQLEKWDGFQSYKKGNVNYIVTCSEEFFYLFMVASDKCKALNLLDKKDRIAVFQEVLYDNFVS